MAAKKTAKKTDYLKLALETAIYHNLGLIESRTQPVLAANDTFHGRVPLSGYVREVNTWHKQIREWDKLLNSKG
jgi:hypothetical protein